MSILEVDALRKQFATLVAVNDVTFSVEEGQVVGLIGPNGAGKTTLLRMLATMLEPTDGKARVCGFDLDKQYLQIRRHIGYMPDFFNLYNDLTITETLIFFAKAYSVPEDQIPARLETVLGLVDLKGKRSAFVKHLSRGMVQRMGVAVLLMHDPALFLLDEPASGLDPKARIDLREVLKRISREGKTVFISSHILTELSDFCSHIAIMNEGAIVQYGGVDEIQRRVYNARRIRLEVLRDPQEAIRRIVKKDLARVVSVEGHRVVVELDGGPEEAAALNTALVKAGIQLVSFAEEKQNLEDLFIQISREGGDHGE